VTSGIAVFFQFALFLLIGVMLFAFYAASSGASEFLRTDTIFPTFIATRMPHVISGFMIAAILAAAMSNLSAALNSLSSTAIVDFYAHIAPQSTEERRVRISRIATIAWAILLFGLALWARHGGKVLEMGLSIASVAYGSLLGVFLLGVLSKAVSELGAIVGMVVGFCLNVYLWQFTRVAFTWYVVFGSMTTLLIGYAASRLLPDQHRPVNAQT
jgi:SSS family solute:Na+ symporter